METLIFIIVIFGFYALISYGLYKLFGLSKFSRDFGFGDWLSFILSVGALLLSLLVIAIRIWFIPGDRKNNSESLPMVYILRMIEKGDAYFYENDFEMADYYYIDALQDLERLKEENNSYHSLIKSELSLKIQLNTIAGLAVNKKQTESPTRTTEPL